MILATSTCQNIGSSTECSYYLVNSPFGDITFGIGIIVAFLSFALIGFVYNSMGKKKPWK